MSAVIETSALRVATASVIDAVALNSHHASSPASLCQGMGLKGAQEQSSCRATANVTAVVRASSAVAAPTTTTSFAATQAPRRGATSIVVATCRDAPLVRGPRVYSLTITHAASTTIPVVPKTMLAIPASERPPGAPAPCAEAFEDMLRSLMYSTTTGSARASAAPSHTPGRPAALSASALRERPNAAAVNAPVAPLMTGSSRSRPNRSGRRRPLRGWSSRRRPRPACRPRAPARPR